jgi:hypothetical protein
VTCALAGSHRAHRRHLNEVIAKHLLAGYGSYTLNRVAIDPAGKVGRSIGANVTVTN